MLKIEVVVSDCEIPILEEMVRVRNAIDRCEGKTPDWTINDIVSVFAVVRVKEKIQGYRDYLRDLENEG